MERELGKGLNALIGHLRTACLLNLVSDYKAGRQWGMVKDTNLGSEDLGSVSDSLSPQARPFPSLYICITYTLRGEEGAGVRFENHLRALLDLTS